MARPDFILFGAPKAGSSSLYAYLKQHPEIYMTPIKEPRWFQLDSLPIDDPDRQHSFYPIKTRHEYLAQFIGASPGQVCGEASVSYMAFRRVAEKLRAEVPDVKLVCVLRHPVERVVSHVLMAIRSGAVKEPLPEAVNRPEYLEPSLYAKHLENYSACFPREAIHVCILNDLMASTQESLTEIFTFIGVDPNFHPDVLSKENVGGLPRSMLLNRLLSGRGLNAALKRVLPSMATKRLIGLRAKTFKRVRLPDAARQRVLAVTRSDTEALERYLQRDLSAWKC